MPEQHYPSEMPKFEIQVHETPRDTKSLFKTHVSFSGAPRKHPYDSSKVILVADPYSTHTFFWEFNKSDISYLEELPNVVAADGQTCPMARIWVKKMSIAVRSTPFVVADTSVTGSTLP
jgi:inorganic pyrophosphatase